MARHAFKELEVTERFYLGEVSMTTVASMAFAFEYVKVSMNISIIMIMIIMMMMITIVKRSKLTLVYTEVKVAPTSPPPCSKLDALSTQIFQEICQLTFLILKSLNPFFVLQRWTKVSGEAFRVFVWIGFVCNVVSSRQENDRNEKVVNKSQNKKTEKFFS